MKRHRAEESNSSKTMEKKPKMEFSDYGYSDTEYVKMPWEDKTTIIVSEDGNVSQAYSRWELIKKGLSREISSVEGLVDTIKSYNVVFTKSGEQVKPNWTCSVLYQYFAQLSEFEKKNFFQENGILSTIRKLSLDLSVLVPKLKVLKTGFTSSSKLHQVQVASILANAFFCTFPKGKADCPSINFNKLYEGAYNSVINYYVEKIKCLMHYFKRIHEKQPTGILSFHRLIIPDHKFPRWDKTSSELCSLKVDAHGRIEDQAGFLQMDFANKYVGGGVLGRGCVQEEIRFLICPELIAARLFTECLADNESLFVAGAERFCQYKGYSNTFEFAGNYEDATPFDENGHRKTYIIILDALYFNHSSDQYRESKILRELKKAYVGFKPLGEFHTLPLATGNWGCGAFKGDPQLKAILQLMASSEAGRDILYLTFGNSHLKSQIEDIYLALKRKAVNVGMLYRIIRLYNRERTSNQTVFEFIISSLNKPGKLSPKSTPSTSKAAIETEFSFCQTKEVIKEQPKEETHCQDFPDMDVDFEALEKEVQSHSSKYCQKLVAREKFSPSPNSSQAPPVKSGVLQEGASILDVMWYESEMQCTPNTKGEREKHSNDPGRQPPLPRKSPSLFSEDEVEKEENYSPVTATGNSSLAKGSKTQNKNMVQSKITDLFPKK